MVVPARLATPIFGTIARTARGRALLRPAALQPAAALWASEFDPADWWINPTVGLALFRPEKIISVVADPKVDAVLCIRGVVRGGDYIDAPAGWPLQPAADVTEALLYDLLKRDTAAVADLRGQFALALWDGRRRRLLLARDHFGRRALFVHTTPDLQWFCSELAPLLQLPGTSAELDLESAFWYLAMGMAAPGRTLHRRISRLPAAHAAIWHPQEPIVEQRYWTPLDAEAPTVASDEVIEQLRGRIDAAVAEQLPTNGEPLGLLLSGGVDSTYLAATLASVRDLGLRTYTVRFEERLQANEHDYAAAVASWLGLPHCIVPVLAEQATEALEQVVLASPEPCSAWATISHFFLLGRVHQDGLSRLVTGLGADEVFGGYDHYRLYYARLLRHLRHKPPPPGVDPFDSVLLPETQAARRTLYPGVARFFDDTALRSQLEPPFSAWHYASHLRAFYRDCRRLKPEADPIEMMVAHECQFRIPDLLMANFEPLARRMGIATEYPFLEPDLVRLAAGLEAASRYRTGAGRFSLRRGALDPGFKWAMMQVARERVPEWILTRPRKSYTAPFSIWMRNPVFAGPVLERMRRSLFWDVGLVRNACLDELLARLELGPGPHAFQLWALLTLIGWFDNFVSRPRAP